jgi:hypothetical protein
VAGMAHGPGRSSGLPSDQQLSALTPPAERGWDPRQGEDWKAIKAPLVESAGQSSHREARSRRR